MTKTPKAAGQVESTSAPSRFLPARAKLWIGSLDDPKLEVRAQYNPKELQIDKQVPWEAHKAKDNRRGGKRVEKNASQQSDLEFNGAPTRSMSIELLFDGYETGDSVEPDVQRLEEMSSVRDPESSESQLRRPHHCVVAWGESHTGMRPFRCVIESLAVKYTMWDHDGTPLRATCTLKVKEAHRMERSAEPGGFLAKGYVAPIERKRADLTGREKAELEARERWEATGREEARRKEQEQQQRREAAQREADEARRGAPAGAAPRDRGGAK